MEVVGEDTSKNDPPTEPMESADVATANPLKKEDACSNGATPIDSTGTEVEAPVAEEDGAAKKDNENGAEKGALGDDNEPKKSFEKTSLAVVEEDNGNGAAPEEGDVVKEEDDKKEDIDREVELEDNVKQEEGDKEENDDKEENSSNNDSSKRKADPEEAEPDDDEEEEDMSRNNTTKKLKVDAASEKTAGAEAAAAAAGVEDPPAVPATVKAPVAAAPTKLAPIAQSGGIHVPLEAQVQSQAALSLGGSGAPKDAAEPGQDASTEAPAEDGAEAPLAAPPQDTAPASSGTAVTVPASTEGTSSVNETDVLSGRGGGTNVHPGNRTFRDLINLHRRAYLKARKNDKPAISRAIVKTIRDSNGRFLKKCETTGLWFEIGDDAAREKTSQALRQRAPEMRKLLFEDEKARVVVVEEHMQRQQQQQQQQQQRQQQQQQMFALGGGVPPAAAATLGVAGANAADAGAMGLPPHMAAAMGMAANPALFAGAMGAHHPHHPASAASAAAAMFAANPLMAAALAANPANAGGPPGLANPMAAAAAAANPYAHMFAMMGGAAAPPQPNAAAAVAAAGNTNLAGATPTGDSSSINQGTEPGA